MKLYFMLVRRVPPVPSPVLVEVFKILKQRGFDIDTGIAEEVVTRPDVLTVEHDLYLLKSHTELSLSLAGILHHQGARTLNPYPHCLAAQDKIVVSRFLRAAGIPAPRCWVSGDLYLLAPLLERGPLIIKPYRGHRGAGIYVVHTPDDLAAVPVPESPMIVQEFIEGSGEDLKVYVIGDYVCETRKEFSPRSFTQAGRPHPLSPEVKRIALRCGAVLGLGLYGLDLIEGPEGPVVVDVNYFPGYKGVPNAAPAIADYITDYARGRLTLRPAALSVPATRSLADDGIITSAPAQ